MSSSPRTPQRARSPLTATGSVTPASPIRLATPATAPAATTANRGSFLSPGLLSPPTLSRPGSASSFSSFNSGLQTPTKIRNPPSYVIGIISSLQEDIRRTLLGAITREQQDSENASSRLPRIGKGDGEPAVVTTTPSQNEEDKEDKPDNEMIKREEDDESSDTPDVTLKAVDSDGTEKPTITRREKRAWSLPTMAWNRLTGPLISMDHRLMSIVKPFAHFLQVLDRHEGTDEGKIKVEGLAKQYPKSLTRRNRRRLLRQLEDIFPSLAVDMKPWLEDARDYLGGNLPHADEDGEESDIASKINDLEERLDSAAEEIIRLCQSDSVQRIIDIMNTAADDPKYLIMPPAPPSPAPSSKPNTEDRLEDLGGKTTPELTPLDPSTHAGTGISTPPTPTPATTPIIKRSLIDDSVSSPTPLLAQQSIHSTPPTSPKLTASSTPPPLQISSSLPSPTLKDSSEEKDDPFKKYRLKLPTLPPRVFGTDKSAQFLLEWCAPENFIRMRNSVRCRVKPLYNDDTGRWFIENEAVQKWVHRKREPYLVERFSRSPTPTRSQTPDPSCEGVSLDEPVETKDDPTNINEDGDKEESNPPLPKRGEGEIPERVLIVQGREFTGKTTLSVRLYDYLQSLVESSRAPDEEATSDTPVSSNPFDSRTATSPANNASSTNHSRPSTPSPYNNSSTTRVVYTVVQKYHRRYWGHISDSCAVGNILGQVARQLAEAHPNLCLPAIAEVVEHNPRLHNPQEALRGRNKEVVVEMLADMIDELADNVWVSKDNPNDIITTVGPKIPPPPPSIMAKPSDDQRDGSEVTNNEENNPTSEEDNILGDLNYQAANSLVQKPESKWELYRQGVETLYVVMIVRPDTSPRILAEAVTSLLNLRTCYFEVRVCVIAPSVSKYQPDDLLRYLPSQLPRLQVTPDRSEIMACARYMAEFMIRVPNAKDQPEKHKRIRRKKRLRWDGILSRYRSKKLDYESGESSDEEEEDKSEKASKKPIEVGLGEASHVDAGRGDISTTEIQSLVEEAVGQNTTEKAIPQLTTPKGNNIKSVPSSPTSSTTGTQKLNESDIQSTLETEIWKNALSCIADSANSDDCSYYKVFLQIQYFEKTSALPPQDLDVLLDWMWNRYISNTSPKSRESAADILSWIAIKPIMMELPDRGIIDILRRTTGSHLSHNERSQITFLFCCAFYPNHNGAASSIANILTHLALRTLGITIHELYYRLADRSISYFLETARLSPYTSYDLFVSGRVRPVVGAADSIIADNLLEILECSLPALGKTQQDRHQELHRLWNRLEANRKAFEYFIWVQGEWQERYVVGGVRTKLLHLAARNGNAMIVANLLDSMRPEVREEAVNATSGNDWTPLHLAAEVGHLNIVKMLLAAGANFDTHTGGKIMKNAGAYGQTASTLAAVEGHDKVVRLLVEAHYHRVQMFDAADEEAAKEEEKRKALESISEEPEEETENTQPIKPETSTAAENHVEEESKDVIVHRPLQEDVTDSASSIRSTSPPPPPPTEPEETPKDLRWKNMHSENRVIIWSGAVNGRENILTSLFDDLAERNLIDVKFTRISAFLGAVRYGHFNLVKMILSWDPRMARMPFQQWDGTTCLHLAVYHPRVLRFLLTMGGRAVVNTVDGSGRTPLDQAIKAEMEESVEALLTAGADVRCVSSQGQSSALTLAARSGYEPVLRTLLEHCADDFKQHSADKRGPIHMSAFSGCTKAIEILVEFGFDPTEKDESGCYAPEAAALGGSVEALKFLWEKGYCAKEPNAKYQPGNTTLLHLAVENGNSNPDMIKFLLSNGADINVADDNGRTPLHAAVLRDDISIAELLLRKGAKADIGEKPALCVAAALGKAEIVHLMLRMGANINCTDCQGSTAISLAGMGGKGSSLIVRELIDAGADLEKPDHLGRSPLNYFCSVGLSVIDSISALLEAGADTGTVDINERSPLHHAVYSGSLPLVRLLLKHDADPNVATVTDNYTPLHIVAVSGNFSCAVALLQAGANVDPITKSAFQAPIHLASFNGHADIVKILLSHGADPNRRCQNTSHSCPLHNAALRGHTRIVKILLDGGADVMMYSKSSTALHYASRHADTARVLLEHGADVHARETDEDGDTVLHVAVLRAEGPAILRLLLVEWGADVEARNNHGHTPLMLAVKKGRTMAATALLECGANVDAREGGTTAMMLAVRKNDRRMVRLLRRWGARGA